MIASPGEPSVRWRVCHDDASGGRFRWGTSDGGFVAEWVGLLVAKVDSAGNLTALEAAPGADPAAIEKLLRGGGVAFARWIAGLPTLHAAGVVNSGVAVALIGPSNAGKSTLAAALCQKAGVGLLSDDILLVRRPAAGAHAWIAEPTERSCSLDATGAGTKRRVPVRDVAVESAPLRAIVDLRFEPEARSPELRRLRGSDAASRIAAALMRFEATPERWKRDLDNAVEMAARVGVWELRRPRDLGAIAAGGEQILRIVAEGA